MGQAAVCGMCAGRTAGQASDVMPAQPQIAPNRPTHEPTCASHQDLHAASDIPPVAEWKDRLSTPPRSCFLSRFGGNVTSVRGAGFGLWRISIQALRCVALHLKRGHSGTPWPVRVIVIYKG